MKNNLLVGSILRHFPYEPTKEQRVALEEIAGFIDSREENILLLTGYAGTGKTSLLGALVKALNELNRKSILLAPTGRAAKVFSEYAGQKAFTIHKKIYRQKTFSNEFEGFMLADNLHSHTLFIVDESSMISNRSTGAAAFGSGYLLNDLIQYISSGAFCKLILMGDTAQLPPVSETESSALNIKYLHQYSSFIREIHLTEVVRQDSESGILFNATQIRESLRRSRCNLYPRLRLNAFSDIETVDGTTLIEKISAAYARDGMDETILICRSNKLANQYNNGIRNLILYREEEISSGDRLMIVKNNYFWAEQIKEIDFLANGEMVEVLRARRTYNMYGFRFCDLLVRLQDYDMELEIRVLLDTLQDESPSLSKEQSDKLFFQILEDYADTPTKAAKIKKIKTDPFFNAVQIKYAYAITCHKAQGGQWQNIFLDIGYVSQEMLGENFYRWLYTALTRTTNRLYLINLPEAFVKK
ncbi:MAG: AAA family ATPase [Tannerella sp.]|jgi:exodeoxyribonuclease-5|nr:AAA family ATPase [Tannerella sp.]